jgi:hypothetical protein
MTLNILIEPLRRFHDALIVSWRSVRSFRLNGSPGPNDSERCRPSTADLIVGLTPVLRCDSIDTRMSAGFRRAALMLCWPCPSDPRDRVEPSRRSGNHSAEPMRLKDRVGHPRKLWTPNEFVLPHLDME